MFVVYFFISIFAKEINALRSVTRREGFSKHMMHNHSRRNLENSLYEKLVCM